MEMGWWRQHDTLLQAGCHSFLNVLRQTHRQTYRQTRHTKVKTALYSVTSLTQISCLYSVN